MLDVHHHGVKLSTYDQVRAGLYSPLLARADDADRADFIKGNMMENTINQLHGAESRTRRRIDAPLFSQARRWGLETQEVVAACERALARLLGTDHLNLIEFTRTISIINAVRIIGIDVDNDDVQAQLDLCGLARSFAAGAVIEDQLRPRAEVQAEVNQALARYDATYFAPSFAARTQRRAAYPGQPATDLLDVMIAAMDEYELGYHDILRESAYYMAAGSDTTTQSTAALMHFVYQYAPSVDAMAHDMPTLQLWLQEVLRLRSVVPSVHRRALDDVTIADVQIAKGTKVDIDLYHAGLDRAYYGEDAETFNPERQLADGVPRSGFAFSAGMHACLGKVLASGSPIFPGQQVGDDHLYGVVTVMAGILLRAGFVPDPDREPAGDPNSSRWSRWVNYPVLYPMDRQFAPVG